MINRVSLLMFTAMAGLSAANANANFVIENNSDDRITVSVLTTENFERGCVNQFETVVLGPGQKKDFITNDVVPGRTVTVFIKSHRMGRNYFEQYGNGNLYKWNRHFARVLTAPYWAAPKKKMGNGFVAREAAQGRFSALVNSVGGARPVRGLQVVPTRGGHKAVKLTYYGYNRQLGQRSW